MAEGEVRIEAVDRKGLRGFIGMAAPLYAGDPNWIQPLFLERLEHLDPRKNPALRRMEVRYWVALKEGRPVGRISAQINQAHLEHYHDATGQFGFLESEDDGAVFAALTATAEGWLRGQGMQRVTGPFSLSINDESGLLVSGCETPPSMMMGHHRPYYGPRLEQAGYLPARDLLAYWFDVEAEWPAPAQRMLQRLARMRSIRVRPIDMKRYADELELMRELFNDAWAGNWAFLPWTSDEVQALGRNIRPLVARNNFAMGEVDGVPAGFVVTLPNVNELIRDLHGRLFPLGFAKLIWRLKVSGARTARMPLMGIRRELHGTTKGAALALGLIAAAKDQGRQQGYRAAELSWILEDNRPVRDVIELAGGRHYKTYRIYEKWLR